MFDSLLILLDGTVDIDTGNAASYVAAISSSTRPAATGAIVLDIRETGVSGLAAVMILPSITSSADYVSAYLQSSDTADMTNTTTGILHHGTFGKAAAVTGRILASETPVVVILRFATDKRYVRLVLAPTNGSGGGNMGKIKCFLEPFSFKVL